MDIGFRLFMSPTNIFYSACYLRSIVAIDRAYFIFVGNKVSQSMIAFVLRLPSGRKACMKEVPTSFSINAKRQPSMLASLLR